jgi:hypothetical protein
VPVVLIVAAVVLVEDHTPPVPVVVKTELLPAHNSDTPDIVPAAGAGLTVTLVVVLAAPHPLFAVYDIVVVPVFTPVNMPVPITIVPVTVLVEIHVPPGMVPVSVISLPIHTTDGPEMGPALGVALTVTTAVEKSTPTV